VSLRGAKGDEAISKGTTNDVDYIYQRYLKAFKKGVYNYIKEDVDSLTQETIPRKYFSGGADYSNMNMAMSTTPTLPARFNEGEHLLDVNEEMSIAGDNASLVPVGKTEGDRAMRMETTFLFDKSAQRIMFPKIVDRYVNAATREKLKKKRKRVALFPYGKAFSNIDALAGIRMFKARIQRFRIVKIDSPVFKDKRRLVIPFNARALLERKGEYKLIGAIVDELLLELHLSSIYSDNEWSIEFDPKTHKNIIGEIKEQLNLDETELLDAAMNIDMRKILGSINPYQELLAQIGEDFDINKLDNHSQPWGLTNDREEALEAQRKRSEHVILDAEALNALSNGDKQAWDKIDPYSQWNQLEFSRISTLIQNLSPAGRQILIMSGVLHDSGYYLPFVPNKSHQEEGVRFAQENIFKNFQMNPLLEEAILAVIEGHSDLFKLAVKRKSAKLEYPLFTKAFINRWAYRLVRYNLLNSEHVDNFFTELKIILLVVSLADIQSSGDRHLNVTVMVKDLVEQANEIFSEFPGVKRIDLAMNNVPKPLAKNAEGNKAQSDLAMIEDEQRAEILVKLGMSREYQDGWKSEFGIGREDLIPRLKKFRDFGDYNPKVVRANWQREFPYFMTEQLAGAILRYPPLAGHNPAIRKKIWLDALGINTNHLLTAIKSQPAMIGLDPERIKLEWETYLGMTRDEIANEIVEFPSLGGLDVENNLVPKRDILVAMKVPPAEIIEGVTKLATMNLGLLRLIIKVAKENDLKLSNAGDLARILKAINRRAKKLTGKTATVLFKQNGGNNEDLEGMIREYLGSKPSPSDLTAGDETENDADEAMQVVVRDRAMNTRRNFIRQAFVLGSLASFFPGAVTQALSGQEKPSLSPALQAIVDGLPESCKKWIYIFIDQFGQEAVEEASSQRSFLDVIYIIPSDFSEKAFISALETFKQVHGTAKAVQLFRNNLGALYNYLYLIERLKPGEYQELAKALGNINLDQLVGRLGVHFSEEREALIRDLHRIGPERLARMVGLLNRTFGENFATSLSPTDVLYLIHALSLDLNRIDLMENIVREHQDLFSFPTNSSAEIQKKAVELVKSRKDIRDLLNLNTKSADAEALKELILTHLGILNIFQSNVPYSPEDYRYKQMRFLFGVRIDRTASGGETSVVDLDLAYGPDLLLLGRNVINLSVGHEMTHTDQLYVESPKKGDLEIDAIGEMLADWGGYFASSALGEDFGPFKKAFFYEDHMTKKVFVNGKVVEQTIPVFEKHRPARTQNRLIQEVLGKKFDAKAMYQAVRQALREIKEKTAPQSVLDEYVMSQNEGVNLSLAYTAKYIFLLYWQNHGSLGYAKIREMMNEPIEFEEYKNTEFGNAWDVKLISKKDLEKLKEEIKAGGHDTKTGDQAMGKQRETGGIDLTPANMHLQMQNAGAGIKFHMNPAMLAKLQNAQGFVPVIINIQPINNLRQFLGAQEIPPSSAASA